MLEKVIEPPIPAPQQYNGLVKAATRTGGCYGAKREYGDANKWHKIFEANRDVIDNPDLIEVGQDLIIPE
jgi:hypothetical protein